MSYFLKYTGFKPYRLDSPSINWIANPYNNKNWMHHFNSLRWLLGENNLERVEKVLGDFYKFHCVNKKRNPYYNELRGDHTAAIRLAVFREIKGRFFSVGSKGGVGICNRLIREEIKNLHSKKIYRAGHNHGLMVDLALLDLIVELPEFYNQVDISLVMERSAKTLDSMWHQSGLTKEHSISYQEYNLPLTVKYFLALEKLGLESSTKVKLDNILEESKRVLGYALKENGEYFPLGDSFRLPDVRILNEVYGGGDNINEDVREMLFPYSTQEGVYSTEDFFIVRSFMNGKKIHLAATCCWNSENHKKNDELSFSLCVDGITIFETPGWSAFASEAVNSYISNESAQSTILVQNLSFSDVKERGVGEHGFLPFDFSRNICTGRHSRFKEVTTFRSFGLYDDKIVITDEFDTSLNLGLVTSKFILAKDVEVESTCANSVVLCKGGVRVEVEAVSEKSGFFKTCSSKVVSTDKMFVDDVLVLDYIRVGSRNVDFVIKWRPL